MSRLTYRHTIAASYLGYITQAIVNNLAPLLFVTFMSEFSLTLEQITLMTTVNFASATASASLRRMCWRYWACPAWRFCRAFCRP